MKRGLLSIILITAVAAAIGAATQNNTAQAVYCKKAVAVEKSYSLELYGTFVHEKSTVIYPPIVGIIQKVTVGKGQAVKKGQAMMVITRDEPGFTRKQSVIEAPFAGIVKLVNAYEGGRFSPNTPLVTIAAIDPIYFYADIREGDIGKVKAGDRLEIGLHYLEVPVEGTVVAVLDVNPQKRMAQLKLQAANPGGAILAGSEGVIRYEYKREPVVLIPAEAVLAEKGAYFVWVKRGDTAIRREIRLGQLRDDGFESLSGVDAGDDVIYYGYLDLQEGSRVTVVELRDEH